MLSKRLTTLVEMIHYGVVADVGTDHAWLLCELAHQERLTKGYAIDIAPGPLQQAQHNIQRFGYQQITLMLSDGLDQLPADTETLVIAGMGRETIEAILSKHWDKLTTVKEIIIQCNTQITKFREYLFHQGVTILDEQWVHDKHDYQLISFQTTKVSQYTPLEQYAGPVLIKTLPSAMIEYYQKRYQTLKKWLPKRQPNQQEQLELTMIETILQTAQ